MHANKSKLWSKSQTDKNYIPVYRYTNNFVIEHLSDQINTGDHQSYKKKPILCKSIYKNQYKKLNLESGYGC